MAGLTYDLFGRDMGKTTKTRLTHPVLISILFLIIRCCFYFVFFFQMPFESYLDFVLLSTLKCLSLVCDSVLEI